MKGLSEYRGNVVAIYRKCMICSGNVVVVKIVVEM